MAEVEVDELEGRPSAPPDVDCFFLGALGLEVEGDAFGSFFRLGAVVATAGDFGESGPGAFFLDGFFLAAGVPDVGPALEVEFMVAILVFTDNSGTNMRLDAEPSKRAPFGSTAMLGSTAWSIESGCMAACSVGTRCNCMAANGFPNVLMR